MENMFTIVPQDDYTFDFTYDDGLTVHVTGILELIASVIYRVNSVFDEPVDSQEENTVDIVMRDEKEDTTTTITVDVNSLANNYIDFCTDVCQRLLSDNDNDESND